MKIYSRKVVGTQNGSRQTGTCFCVKMKILKYLTDSWPWSSCGSYPKLNTCWKTQIFFLLLVTALPMYGTMVFTFPISIKTCHNFQYFVQHIKHFWKKFLFINFFHSGIRIGMPWIRFRQNDADRTRSGSTTLRIRSNKLISNKLFVKYMWSIPPWSRCRWSSAPHRAASAPALSPPPRRHLCSSEWRTNKI